MAKVEILLQQPGSSLGTFGALVIAATDGPNAFLASATRRAVDEIARLRKTTHAKRLIYVYVAGQRSNLPGPEARATSAEIASHIDACVGVHEGEGFRASAVRAVVVGISMLGGGKVRPEVVSTISEAAARLHARFPDLGTEVELRQALETVRHAAGEWEEHDRRVVGGSRMGTLVGMAAILGIIGGLTIAVVCLGALVTTLWDLRKIARVVGGPRTPIAQLAAETEATVHGTIERALEPELPSVTSPARLVFRHVIITELVGRRSHERLNERQGVRFVVRDPSGSIEVSASDSTGLAVPSIGGGRPSPAALELARGTFAWPRTPKTCVETGLRVGDRVTVKGTVERNADGTLRIDRSIAPVLLVGGDGRVGGTPEAGTARALAIGFVVSLAISGVSYLVLPLTRQLH